MYYDLPVAEPEAPQVGDVLDHESAVRRVRSWLVITEARPVESTIWPNRWALRTRRLDGPPVGHVRRVWPCRAYARGERPRA